MSRINIIIDRNQTTVSGRNLCKNSINEPLVRFFVITKYQKNLNARLKTIGQKSQLGLKDNGSKAFMGCTGLHVGL